MSESRFNWGVAFWIFYVVMGLVQFNATYDGLRYYLGWHWLILASLSLIASYLPLIGSICGVVGAHLVWRWEVLPALLLFFWYVPLYLTFMAASHLPWFTPEKSPAKSSTPISAADHDPQDMPHREAVTDRPKKKNILGRATNGELSLAVTFWCFGVLALSVLFAATNSIFSEPAMPFWYTFIEHYGFMTFKLLLAVIGCCCLVYRITIMVGIWKSANRYTGSKIWANAAKGFVILWIWGAIAQAGEVINIFTTPEPNSETATPRLPLNNLDTYRNTVRDLLN